MHTGQHDDHALSDVFFDELGVPAPDHQLHPASVRLAPRPRRYGACRPRADPVAARPELVLVYGDTNSTLAGALTARSSCVCRPPTWRPACARSTARCPRSTTGCWWTTPATFWSRHRDRHAEPGARVGPQGETHLVGDVMADVSLTFQAACAGALDPRSRSAGLEPGGYLLVTAHRAGNVDSPERLLRLVELLEGAPGPRRVPRAPRARAGVSRIGPLERLGAVSGPELAPPLGVPRLPGAGA